MKLIGLLCWYDESPSWLAACVASMAAAGVDHVVAVDGAYRLYPEGRPRSSGNQQETILKVAYGTGIGATVHAPQELWAGNEVEKRGFMFKLAEQIAVPGRDWYLVMDADEILVKADQLRAALDATDLNVAELLALEYQDPLSNPTTAKAARQINWPREHGFKVRKFFRALPGLTVEGNHYTYGVPGNDVKLWGNPTAGVQLEDALDLSLDVKLEHRTNLRDVARKTSQVEYYKVREQVGSEQSECARCHRPGTKQIPTGFEPHPDGMVAGWTVVCDTCAPEVEAENEAAIRAAGYDPAELSVDMSRPVSA